jgi:hypothetical protein
MPKQAKKSPPKKKSMSKPVEASDDLQDTDSEREEEEDQERTMSSGYRKAKSAPIPAKKSSPKKNSTQEDKAVEASSSSDDIHDTDDKVVNKANEDLESDGFALVPNQDLPDGPMLSRVGRKTVYAPRVPAGMEMTLEGDMSPCVPASFQAVHSPTNSPKKMPPPVSRPEGKSQDGDVFEFGSSGDSFHRTDSVGSSQSLSEMSTSSAASGSTSAASSLKSQKGPKKASKQDKFWHCFLSADDIKVDEEVLRMILKMPTLQHRIDGVRVNWGLVIAGKNVLIPDVQKGILHYFFHLVWKNLDKFNPIQAVFQHLNTVDHLVKGKKFISDRLYEFLILTEHKAEKGRGIRYLCQRLQEYYKYSVRNSVQLLGLRGRDCCTGWADVRTFEVLRKACKSWSISNTFSTQQLDANANFINSRSNYFGAIEEAFEPQTILECIILSLKVCKVDDDFYLNTSHDIEAQILTLLLENFKGLNDEEYSLVKFRGLCLNGIQVCIFLILSLLFQVLYCL